MEKQTNPIDDMINRYVYQVTKHLSSKNRKDIEEELKTLIYDMLDEKAKGNAFKQEDINAVLKELGNPYDLAAKYSDREHYLIGPVIYPTYLTVLKIVLAATLFGLSIALFLDLLTTQGSVWYKELGECIGSVINSLFSAFAWVTVIFAIFERNGVNFKKINQEWEPSSLPPTPSKELTISMVGPMLSIIVSIFGVIIFVFAPQLMGVYYYTDITRVIPIFDLVILQKILPLFLIGFGLGIAKSIWEIIERRISVRYALFATIVNFIIIVLNIVIFTQFPIWNPNFITEQNSLFHISGNTSLEELWNQLTHNLVIFLVAIYILETATLLYKAFKYDYQNK